jgi:hypothetical protein
VATTGIAVATAIASKAVNMISATSPTLSARKCGDSTLTGAAVTDPATLVVMVGSYGEPTGQHIGREA